MRKMLLISAVAFAFTSVAQASLPPSLASGDVSSADIQWAGHAKIIPGNGITITGENGASEANDGVLQVNADGTFITSKPVKLESHVYKDGKVGELIATHWAVDDAIPISVTWGTNIVAGMEPSVLDSNSGAIISEDGKVEIRGTSHVSLHVSNKKPVTTPPANPRAELTVNATILATVL